MVAGPIDLYTGGKGGKTPMRKLIPFNDRGLSIQDKGEYDETKKQKNAGDGRSAPI